VQPYCDIGVKRRQAGVEADQTPTVVACQTGQLGVGDLPVPEHAAPGNVGVRIGFSNTLFPSSVPPARRAITD